jgi:hypothetical protein
MLLSHFSGKKVRESIGRRAGERFCYFPAKACAHSLISICNIQPLFSYLKQNCKEQCFQTPFLVSTEIHKFDEVFFYYFTVRLSRFRGLSLPRDLSRPQASLKMQRAQGELLFLLPLRGRQKKAPLFPLERGILRPFDVCPAGLKGKLLTA